MMTVLAIVMRSHWDMLPLPIPTTPSIGRTRPAWSRDSSIADSRIGSNRRQGGI